MLTQKITNGLLALLFIALFSCKGKDGEVGPQGPKGDSYDPSKEWSFKEGYIKGTATGERLDGTTFSYNFDLQGNYSARDNQYRTIPDDKTGISINKSYAGEGDALEYAEFHIAFSVESLSDLSTPTVTNAYFNFSKDLGQNVYHEAYYSYYSGSQSGTVNVSDLSYDATSGILTGKYTVDFSATSYMGKLSITNGTFSTKLSKIVAKKAL